MSTTSLVLDSEIRDWVFIPIVVVMFFVGILRTNIAVLLQAKKKPKVEDIIDSYVTGACDGSREATVLCVSQAVVNVAFPVHTSSMPLT